MKSIIILFAFIGIRVGQGENRINFLEIGQFECEGHEISNYTYITRFFNKNCQGGYTDTGHDQLISCQQNGLKVVIQLQLLVKNILRLGEWAKNKVDCDIKLVLFSIIQCIIQNQIRERYQMAFIEGYSGFCIFPTLANNKFLEPAVNILDVEKEHVQAFDNFYIYNLISESKQAIYYQYEALYLAEGGNLEGKFVYLKEIGTKIRNLKICSILRYSYKSTKSQVLLIADKLDPNIFLNPTGAFQQFKESATTICQGNSIIV